MRKKPANAIIFLLSRKFISFAIFFPFCGLSRAHQRACPNISPVVWEDSWFPLFCTHKWLRWWGERLDSELPPWKMFQNWLSYQSALEFFYYQSQWATLWPRGVLFLSFLCSPLLWCSMGTQKQKSSLPCVCYVLALFSYYFNRSSSPLFLTIFL